MNKLDLYIADKYLSHQIDLLRFTAGEQNKTLALLKQMQVELKAKLRSGLTDFSKARVNKVLKEAKGVIDDYYAKTAGIVDSHALAKNEAKFTTNTFAGIGLEASLPTEAALKALVNGSLIEGAKSSAWWARQSEDMAFKFANQVRQGIVQNETLQQIIRRVAGSKRLGIPGIMDVSRRNASALVHTSIMQVANDARMATFRANDDIIKGMRFLATLDSHTSLTCIAHSGAEWDMEGKPIAGNFPFEPPPLHFNCRSLLVPVTLSYKELGIDVPEIKGTRASDLGQIKSDITFDAFLKRHDAAYVDDLLGPGRAKLWRDGKITLNDLVNQTGRPLTLKELAAKSGGKGVVSAAQKKAVFKYTGEQYNQINGFLREKRKTISENAAKTVKDLDGFFKNAPKTDIESFRGLQLRKERFNQWKSLKKGDIFHDKGFMSTTSDVNVMKEFQGIAQYQIEMRIKGKNGVLIETLSALKAEKEILFPRDSAFKVVGIKVKKTKTTGNILLNLLEI